MAKLNGVEWNLRFNKILKQNFKILVLLEHSKLRKNLISYLSSFVKTVLVLRVLYISTSILVLCTPNAGPNDHFQNFYSVFFFEKSKKFAANFS